MSCLHIWPVWTKNYVTPSTEYKTVTGPAHNEVDWNSELLRWHGIMVAEKGVSRRRLGEHNSYFLEIDGLTAKQARRQV